MRSQRRILSATASLMLVTSLAACGGGEDSASSAAEGTSSSGGTLTVFAAASLTDVYKQINTDFEKQHPGVKVTMTNGGSNDLVSQIEQGAPADVLATADTKNMDKAVAKKLIAGSPATFATNDLTIAVQPGNPHHITGLKDLASNSVTVVRCAPAVPCGTVTDAILKDTGVALKPASEENSVTDVLTKVSSGEADAGLVYTTDVKRSKGKTEAVAIPEAAAHRTQYPIAVTQDSHNAALAKEYVAFMTSAEAQKPLKDAGFGTP